MKVLVVDDNSFNLDILVEYLAEEGYESVCAENALSALKYLEENEDNLDIDIILLDRMMPHMDGLQMFERLRRDHRFCDIPVIMVTAAADQKAVAEGRKAGIDTYITKPFEREILISAMEQSLQKRKAS